LRIWRRAIDCMRVRKRIVVGAHRHHFECVADRAERVAQLVAEDGEEAVFRRFAFCASIARPRSAW
jgi:hypothetical protein